MAGISKRTKITAAIIAIGALAIAIAFSQGLLLGKPSSGGAAKTAVAVSVTSPQARDLPIELTAQGHLVALNQVDVRPKVTGVIRSVDFHEGDAIREGQLLFTLDDSEIVAQLRRAEATVAQVKAQLDDALREQGRAQDLFKAKFVSQSAVDSAISKADALRAQLMAAHADIDNMRAQVGNTRIVSPLSGRAGALNVHVGSLAMPTAATPLVSLAQFDPIGVEFSLPEANLATLLAAKAEAPVKVALDTPDGQRVEGLLSFVNNTVTTGTGTIALKATFANPRQTLWPGAYVKTTVRAGVSKGAMVLPPEAILEGPAGRFVYLLDASNQVSAKPVTLVRVQDQRAVVEGLQAGDRVVLDGNQSVSPGTTAQIAPRTAKP